MVLGAEFMCSTTLTPHSQRLCASFWTMEQQWMTQVARDVMASRPCMMPSTVATLR